MVALMGRNNVLGTYNGISLFLSSYLCIKFVRLSFIFYYELWMNGGELRVKCHLLSTWNDWFKNNLETLLFNYYNQSNNCFLISFMFNVIIINIKKKLECSLFTIYHIFSVFLNLFLVYCLLMIYIQFIISEQPLWR